MKVRWHRAIVIALFCLVGRSCLDLHFSTAAAEEAPVDPRMGGVVELLDVSPRFAEWERDAIERAADGWTLSTSGVAVVRVGANEPIVRHSGWQYANIVIRPVDENEPLLYYLDFAVGGTIMGVTDVIGYVSPIPTIYIAHNRIWSDEEYHSTLLHELGHSIGLMHSHDRSSIMWPYDFGPLGCITTDDLSQFCELYQCDYDLPQTNGCNSDLTCR